MPKQIAETVSVSDVMLLAERSTPEHLFWALQTALGQLIDSHYQKEPADLPSGLASLQRALVNGPTWKRALHNDGDVDAAYAEYATWRDARNDGSDHG
jgi:hypothetical protein